ncbi:Pc07g00060 [Penicillium rubens Wisconsin 54-1255]|uniref:Pc07g00060 protein n=1 Tax=Penicillium rubens (strain ATCC 28089 / DSM 1075 / NRRL 1951 / Wisconsin 54-1255) TaxID=500485 RepID=B6GWI6_PENRW|nr:Pc07g00060 [Penicillium rubens Wisconsin 54-1255]
MRAGVDSASILLLLLAVLVVARPHDEQIHTATSTHPYHSSPTFPLPKLPYEMIIEQTPACVYSHGIAYMDATTENIDHLSKVSETLCNVDAGNCHRLSYANLSGIFLCNYGSVLTALRASSASQQTVEALCHWRLRFSKHARSTTFIRLE